MLILNSVNFYAAVEDGRTGAFENEVHTDGVELHFSQKACMVKKLPSILFSSYLFHHTKSYAKIMSPNKEKSKSSPRRKHEK